MNIPTLLLVLSPTLSPAAPSVPQANTGFGLELYRKLATEPGNIFFSPYSVTSALAMTSAGAKGTTFEEMKKALQLPKDFHKQFGALNEALKPTDKDDPVLKIANRLWTKTGRSYRPEFLSTSKNSYGAEPMALNYEAGAETARATINEWIEKNTEGRIKDLLPSGSVKKETDLVLTNAIYFKGAWDKAFKQEDTKKESFFPESGKPEKHSFLHSGRELDYAEDENFQAVRLPYKGYALSMNILLPKKGKKLSTLTAKVTPGLLENLRGKFAMFPIDLALPKFRMEYSRSLEDLLPKMGMRLPFTDKANFSGLRELGPQEVLYIGAVAHKAFIEIDEEGTEAAAATAVVMMVGSAYREPKPRKVFEANRPFLFWIEHQPTKTVLFMGRMAELSGN